jgi:DNA-binding NarL/FixJ family response regulator
VIQCSPNIVNYVKAFVMIYLGIADDHNILRSSLKLLLESTGLYKVIIDSPDGAAFCDAIENA